MNEERQQFIVEIQSLIFNDQFDEADSVSLMRCQADPSDPTPFLFRATALMARMAAEEENSDGQLLKELLDSVDVLTALWIDSSDANTSAWMCLYRGHTRAYRSLWESRFGSFFSAVRIGLSSSGEYQKGFDYDSHLVDLYAGLGAYHYWKSAKAGFLRWIGVFKNEKKKGLDELYLAADSSVVHRESARSSLIWIWFDQKQYDSAVAIAREFITAYPDGTTFYWPVAQAFYKQERYDSAVFAFEQIRSRLTKRPGNFFNLIECDYHIAKCYSWLSSDEGLDTTVQRFLGYREKIPKATRKKQRSKVLYLERLSKR